MVRILDILERDPKVDAIMTELTTSLLDRRESLGQGYVDDLLDILGKHHERSKKPYFTTIYAINQEMEAIRLRDWLMERGIASFPGFHRSANAYRKLVDYYRFRESVSDGADTAR